MNIDTLNAYCGPVLVAGPSLCQGRFYLHPSGCVRLAPCTQACIVRSCCLEHRAGLRLRPTSSNWCAWLWFDTRGFAAFVSCLPAASSFVGIRRPAAPVQLEKRRPPIFLDTGQGELASLSGQFFSRPDIKEGYPPNLSILISGGKENNSDSLSNGE